MCAKGVSGEERGNDVWWILQLRMQRCNTLKIFTKLAPVTWLQACLVCYHTSPGHRCGRVWITTLSWELFGWAFMLGSHRTCTLYSRYHRLYSHHRVRRAIPPPPTVASHTLPHAWRGFLWSASKQPLSDLAPLHQATNHMRLCSQFERGLMYNFRNIRKSTGRVRSFDKYLEHSVL